LTALVDRLGEENAAVVVKALGGTRVAVPDRLDHGRPPSRLEQLFGAELAVLLVLHFGGTYLYVPRLEEPGRLTLRRVVRMTRAGKSANAIARALRCSDRAVYLRRAEARAQGLLPTR
jgi:hypothetical protein